VVHHQRHSGRNLRTIQAGTKRGLCRERGRNRRLAVAPVLTTQSRPATVALCLLCGRDSRACLGAFGLGPLVKEPARHRIPGVNRAVIVANYASILRSRKREAVLSGGNRFSCAGPCTCRTFLPRFTITETSTGCNYGWISSGRGPGWEARFWITLPGFSESYWPQARSAHHGGAIHGGSDNLLVPSLYQHLCSGSHTIPDETRRSGWPHSSFVLLPTVERSGRLGGNRHRLVT